MRKLLCHEAGQKSPGIAEFADVFGHANAQAVTGQPDDVEVAQRVANTVLKFVAERRVSARRTPRQNIHHCR